MPMLLDLESGDFRDGGPADLVLAHDDDIMAAAPPLTNVRVLSVVLPKFRDGRAFTQIRVLRERHGFVGEIRVEGHVLPDQALMLKRVGASTIMLSDMVRAGDFRAALKAYRHAYQRPAEGLPAYGLRGGA